MQVLEAVNRISHGRGAENLPGRRREVEVNIVDMIRSCLLTRHDTDQHVSLVAMDIDDETCEFLCDLEHDLLPHLPSQNLHLHLRSNKIADRGMLAVSLAVWQERSVFGNLRYLDLRSNIIGDSSMMVFSHLLAVNNRIAHLNLADNKVILPLPDLLSPTSCFFLPSPSSILLSPSPLLNTCVYFASSSDVNLHSLQIGKLGVLALASSLGLNSSLLELDLSFNLICEEDVAPLAAVLSWNKKLLLLVDPEKVREEAGRM